MTLLDPVPYNEDMQASNIQKILEIYLARTETALAALLSEDWDTFDSAMRGRTAAFHNFRAADHLAQKENADYLTDPVLQALGQKLQEVEQSLAKELEKQRDRLNQKLEKISRHRDKIGKFHSGVQEEAGFQKSV